MSGLIYGKYNTTPETLGSGQDVPVQTDAQGRVLTSGSGGTTDTLIGALTETAPATDIASSGLNGRLQRIAQRITSMIALLPSALGPLAASLSLSVVTNNKSASRIAAGQSTAQFGGGAGAVGDWLSHVVLQPAAVGAGTTTLFDGAVVEQVYTAGTLADLRPIYFLVGRKSTSGGWNITTGANMPATGYGTWTP